ncbi:MAG: N-acetyltransferase, partial [Phototrophicales bacterium]
GLHGPDLRNRSSEVGISIGQPSYWDQGYGTDAMRVLLRYGFYEINLHRIELKVYSFNERAIRSYEKLGFQKEVVARQAIFRDGQYHDVIIMGLLRSEWRDVRE